MISKIAFQNFKSWESLELKCAPITGIFGTNSSGKSSILQFLLMLKQTKDATDRATALELNGDFVELGSFSDVVFRHDMDRVVSWSIEFDLSEELALHDSDGPKSSPIAKGRTLSIESSVSTDRLAPQSNFLTYGLNSISFSLKPKPGNPNHFDLTTNASRFSFRRSTGRPWQLPRPIKSYAFPDQARTYYQNASILADLEFAYERAIDGIYYLGPLRQFPRDYMWARSRPSDVGKQGERAIDAILAATEAGETRNLRPKAHRQPFQRMVAHWLQTLGLIHEFRVEEIKEGSNRWQALLRTKAEGAEVLLTDVGFGISQVLPVITLLQYVPENSTVVLEQPEIHLHPKAQAALADAIIQAATHRRVQVIIESHSEHLLRRLQLRVAEEEISNELIALYFIDAPNGRSTATALDLDLLGAIRNWPKDFFGDPLGETARAELKRIERRRKALEAPK
jgi:predicted ATPase